MNTTFTSTSLILLVTIKALSQEAQQAPQNVAPVSPPTRFFDSPEQAIRPELPEALDFIRLAKARADFREPGVFELNGEGVTVAVLDTGLRTSHKDFKNRVPAQKNFTNDNGGDVNDASDRNGHGTNVGGIIVAGDIHTGVAPAARIIPLKVLPDTGGGSFQWIESALQWVKQNQSRFGITVVNMSLGDSGNYTSDNFVNDGIGALISELRAMKIAVVVASGNDFFSHDSKQGMGYPAIFRDTVSVGAVYDSSAGNFSYYCGAMTNSSAAGQITPFSQRLHQSVHTALRTDIFAPGAPITATGHTSDTGVSTQSGTSQATPVTSGLILLMQQYYKHKHGNLPTVDQLEGWLRSGGRRITDNYGNVDNVINTNLEFIRLDAVDCMQAVKNSIP